MFVCFCFFETCYNQWISKLLTISPQELAISFRKLPKERFKKMSLLMMNYTHTEIWKKQYPDADVLHVQIPSNTRVQNQTSTPRNLSVFKYINQNCQNVRRLPQKTVKINWCLFTKCSCFYYFVREIFCFITFKQTIY